MDRGPYRPHYDRPPGGHRGQNHARNNHSPERGNWNRGGDRRNQPRNDGGNNQNRREYLRNNPNPRNDRHDQNNGYQNNTPRDREDRGFNRGYNNSNNDNRRQNYAGPRPQRTMGFKYVEDLIKCGDIQKVLMDLSNDKNGFSKLLNSPDISNDLIVLLVKLLSYVCSSTFQDIKISILTTALTSRFLEKLIVYITSLQVQRETAKRQNKYFWNDPDEFWSALLELSKTVQGVIPSYCETISQILGTMLLVFPSIERANSMHISDEIKLETGTLLEIVNKTMQAMEVKAERKSNKGDYNNDFEDEREPPNDFREIDIIPTAQEVLSYESAVFLRKNIVDKAYKDIDHYLDIQFRLLREDFVAPLRRGIRTYLDNQTKAKKDQKKLDDIKICHPVRFLSLETLNECNCYKIQFDFGNKKRTFKYENSKRFMFGSLVCFTSDNFNTLLFGKIVERDVKMLEQGFLTIGFQEEVNVMFDVDYLMIESSVYFEPYYHVLSVLKHMDNNSFPMEKYIIKVETSSAAPEYLRKAAPVIYQIDDLQYYALNLPMRRFYTFNDSQLHAFRAALTEEFCIIQGPPGTGKTYLGLKIAHTLLQNKDAWYSQSPILVICYTNHALDQFLEGILPVTTKILRVGGQSKNEALKQYNLAVRRRAVGRQPAAILQKRREVQELMSQQKSLNETLNQIDANAGVISFKRFSEVVENFSNTWFARVKDEEVRKWLLEGKSNNRERNNQRELQEAVQNLQLNDNDVDSDEDDEFLLEDEQRNDECLDDVFQGLQAQGYRPMVTKDELKNDLKNLNGQLEDLRNKPENLDVMLSRENLQMEIWERQTDLDYLTTQLEYYCDPHRRRQQPAHIDLKNPFNMSFEDRWRLYYTWLNRYTHGLRQKYNDFGNKFREVYRVYNEMRDIEDTQLMKEHLVIGMTTTGAARLQSTLQALKCPIVIVEEAAEVLEAHIVAALTNSCQHLILIGDHLQLKPGAADYRIETKYNLGISLFERMVKNKIKCYTLNVQHRMRPEISRLIKPHIYPELQDHTSTLHRSPIFGIENCLFFINHEIPEEKCQDSSKKNTHEATFLIALARHLILNGYRPEQITILAAYLGQFFEMVREKKKNSNRMLLQDVRISVLDNYQGEESDIILLSLVRSNDENNAGFLKIQNRVCVALSRARDGFFIMGNMSLLLNCNSENKIWEKVNGVLKDQNAIGRHLTLRCQVHRHKLTKVSDSADFSKLSEGGCELLCGAPVACGHLCKRLCHVQDRDHVNHKCNEKCTRLTCNDPNHICQKLCYEDCGPCVYLVRRHLDCGHQVHIPCHIDPAKFACQVPVMTKLPCDHQTMRPCSVDPHIFKCPFPCDTRVEPCGHACDRKCHIRMDPDHLQYNCRQPCARPRIGCKSAENKHICTKLCYQECEECNKIVRKNRSCGHMHDIPCKEDVESVECERRCKRTLGCGHPCRNKCLEKCGPCEVLVEKAISGCEHPIKVKCYQSALRNLCKSKVCPRPLPCGHKCKQPCRLPCTVQCTEIVDCQIKSSCGHTSTKIMCHLKNTNDPKTITGNCSQPCGATLKCNHKCSGTCGECMQSRVHKRCAEKCGVPLVCNHECPIPCREACKPCTKNCEMKCKHSRCRKKCGEPCTPCRNECSRKCQHVECKNPCGDLCSVDPCVERCTKRLKCGHRCVGFCGDPCPPLCRFCNNDELTEIFFGTEDEEDAIFVLLTDCGHVFEHTGLENWLNAGDNQIQFKTCPRCKTNITTTERYSDYVKRAIKDVISAKEKSFGNPISNEPLREGLIENLKTLPCPYQLIAACPKLTHTFEILLTRLQPSRNDRRQTMNKIELNAVQSKYQAISYIIECFRNLSHTITRTDPAITIVNLLLDIILRSDDYTTNQEIEDIELEIKRVHRIIQFNNLVASNEYRYAKTNSEVITLVNIIQSKLYLEQRFSGRLDTDLKFNLTELARLIKSAMAITDKERMDIVKAIGLDKGHWFKCPNGHPYAIGECGGAMQIARCFCGAQIGGTNHHLLESNRFAGEMDGAQRHAWPGGLH